MGTKESRVRTHYRMSRVRQKDTNTELVVRSRLHLEGLRFRKNVKDLPGAPDIVFPKQKLAVFVDGDFWHGYDLPRLRSRVSQYWIDKISGTVKRDQRNVSQLQDLGWHVVRVWGHEVEQDLDGVVRKVKVVLGCSALMSECKDGVCLGLGKRAKVTDADARRK